MIHDHGGDGEAKTIYQRPIKIKILLKEEGFNLSLFKSFLLKYSFVKSFCSSMYLISLPLNLL